MESKSSFGKIAGLLAVVALVAVGAVFFMNRSDQADSTPSASQQSVNQEPATAQSQTASDRSIAEVASGNQNLSTLVAALRAAELVPTLSGQEEYTVFAPTNAAFEKLPAGTLDTLLRPESRQTLTGILTYHVVSGETLSSELSNGQRLRTVNGAELTVAIENGSVYLVDAKGGRAMVSQADMQASNGVIHAIDSVLMP